MAKKTKNQKNTTKSTAKHATKHTSQETRYIEKAFEDSLKGIRKLHSKEKNTAMEGDRISQWAQYDMDDRRFARRRRAAEAYLELARECAIKNCAETLFSSEMEKNEPDRYGFATRWGRFNSLPQIGYDGLNRDTYLTVGAAIWILDRIRDYNLIPFLDENGKIERNEYGYPKTRKAKLMEILPMVDEAEDIDMPHLWDCTHSEEIIREVVAVIEQRNDDCIGRKHKEDRLYRPFLDSFTTEGTHKQDVPSRRRFETLLSLIPEEDMLDMAEQYETLMWEWMGMYLTSVNEFLQKEDVIYQKVQKKHKELDALYGEAEKRLKALRSGKSKNQNGSTGVLAKGPVANPLLMNPQQGFPVNPLMGGVGSMMSSSPMMNAFPMMGGGSMMNTATLMGSGTPIDDIAFKIPELERECDRLEKQFIEMRNSELETLFNLEKLFSEPEGAVITRMNLALKDEEAAVRAMDAFSGIAIQDPYSICFGLLYLIDSGSDLPWLYFPALSVAKLAAVHLPWYGGTYDEEEDDLWELPGDSEDEFMDDALDERDDADGDAVDGNAIIDGNAAIDEEALSDAEYIRMRERIQWEKNHREISFPKSLRVPEIPDWYRLNLTNKEEEDYFGDRVSLSRIVYDMTGAIMPRNLKRYERILPALSNFGIRGKKALPYEYVMLLLGEAQRQTQDWRDLSFDEGAFSTREEAHTENSSTDNDSGETQQLKKQLAEMKRELAVLKETAYSANRAVQEEKRKNEKLREESEKERQELYALRELVFARENGVEEEVVEETIALPYTVGKRTVVFGGHDSWARAIKPMLLGDIRFVPRSTKPSADLIRHAEIIWIQTNSISHKEYYSIMNVIRANNIPIEYFQYASAGKCARQLAERDMEK